MNKFFPASIVTFLILLLTINKVRAQHTVQFQIVTKDSTLSVYGINVNIQGYELYKVTDSTGRIIIGNLTPGPKIFLFTNVGFQPKELRIEIPVDTIIIVEMEASEEHEEEVIVMATRSSRTIYDIPTRVEVISGEELDEKSNMKPGEIRMLLNESTGIQSQQTSATSYNSSIRIQGLDGRYTQLLRDGYPLFGGFSSSLSLMQMTPLDLKQVEVIKGSVSTLYGGGAIAGLVNLVSKTPGKERELNFLANATSAAGYDLSGFYSERYKTTGLTLFGSVNHGQAYDPSSVGFTAIPRFDRFTIHPRLFIYGKKTNMDLGVYLMREERMGGDMNFVKNGAATGYFESNKTVRVTPNLGIEHNISDDQKLILKSSFSYFDRRIEIPVYYFEGLQKTFFSELTYTLQKNKAVWIAGLNYSIDDFKEEQPVSIKKDYRYSVPGIFVQNNFDATEKLSFETGIRTDYSEQYGWEFLPRVSLFYKAAPKLSFRIGGGKGYKLPGLFTEESEKILYKNLMPVQTLDMVNERSSGGNFDINFRTRIGEMGFSINQMFFYTRINDPEILELNPADNFYYFKNANGHIDTRGIETNLKLEHGMMKLFIGYTYTDANTHYDNELAWLPLTSRHRLNNVLMMEKENNFRIGLEGYFFSPQKLSDGARGQDYWIFGFMAEKLFPKFSVFINFENFTDTRQTKMDTIYTGPIDSPVFRDIYAPLDGFVINGGIKVRL